MSASPQPPPPATIQREEPVPAHANGSPPASSSPAQLAALLTKSLQEAESLRADLARTTRRADKAERLLATFQSSSQSPPNASPPGSSQGAPSKPHIPDAARKAIVDSENRAERAEQARDEAEARLRMLQESWLELDRFLGQVELRNTDARAQFSRIVQDAGGTLIPVHSIPSQNTVYLPTALQQQAMQLPPLPLPSSRAHLSVRGRLPASSQPFPSVSLPPPPSASSSRVRPRAGSMDAGYNSALTGPGAPPPAKRPRSDRDGDRGRDRYSVSPSNSPHPAYLTNGHGADHSPSLVAHHTSNTLPALHPHAYQTYHRLAERDDPSAARYPTAAYPSQHQHRHRRGRSTSRDHDSRSRSRSRASSTSIDEMLLEATTTPADDRTGPDGHLHPRAAHPAQHLHPSSSSRHRSPSPNGRSSEYHLAVSSQHARSRAHSSVQLHPSAHAAGAVGSPPGPLAVPGQVQTYQTHIFAPPVTGAPVKKSKLSGAGSALSANGSVLTLGPTGSVISGPSSLGGGGFPPTNAQGQRICRQCGLPGRYKEGKCVEKWGPGPEGPGTVCDRCRKKMKRVERRGTLDGQSAAAQMHHAPAAIHPSGAPQAAPGSGAYTNGRSVHRSDTMHIHPSSQSQSQSQPHSQPPSQSRSALGPGGTQLISSSGSSPYGRHDRDREYDRGGSPHSRYSSSGGRPSASGRSPQIHPHIATLPGASVEDEDLSYDDAPHRSRARSSAAHLVHAHRSSVASVNGHGHGHGHGSGSGSSRSASHSPKAAVGGSTRGSPRGSDGKSKSSDLMDVDADGEEVDADADADPEQDADAEADDADADADADPEAEAEAEGDADADLLDAVDAAEANHNAEDESEWLKKEDA
ncbi:hypothetical protein C8Q79DRAFT_1114008 [Trametes meyenii]|nr:hypothetical protein C8Q79DRAFT_1114008 [Trametes meyenii]